MDVGSLRSHRWRAAWAAIACIPFLSGCVTTIEEQTPDGRTISRHYYPWQNIPPESTAKQNASENLTLKYARVLESKGQTLDARTSYENVLRQNPKSSEALLGMARLDQLAGRTASAEQNYVKAVNSDPNDPCPLAALGNFYAENKRWNEAVGLLNQATQKAPDDRKYRYELAVVLARAGQPREALTQFMQAVTPAEAHYNMALIAYEGGDLNGAEEHLALSLTKNPRLEDAQVWLAEVRREKDAQIASANGIPGSGLRAASGGIPANANPRMVTTAAPATTGRPATPATLARPAAGAPGTRRPGGVNARNTTFTRPSRNGSDRSNSQNAAAAPIPASAGHNPPPGFTEYSEQQWEQWRNQNQEATQAAAAVQGYGY